MHALETNTTRKAAQRGMVAAECSIHVAMGPQKSPESSAPLLWAIALTAVALASANLLVAYGLARAAGLRVPALPEGIACVLVVVATATSTGAIYLWRRFLAGRQSSPP